MLKVHYQMACLLVLSSVITSCLPDPLEVKGIPDVKPEIVVNTQILPGESLVVLLTKTFGALEASGDSDPEELINQIAVNDATVIIESPESVDTLLFLENGFYGGISLDLEEGAAYHLRVISESLGEVSATTTVKPQVRFDDVEAELYFTGFDDTLAQITYQLNDPEGKNFYMINVQHISLENSLDQQLLNPRAFTKVLSDEGFDGQSFGETFRAFPRDYAAGDTVSVFLSNISEDYYNFIQLRLDTRFSFVEFVSEPVNYPSNVIGGRGFFNLYIPDVRFFIMDELE